MKKRSSLFILIFILLTFILNIKIKAYDTYYSGDLVRYKNIAFYVLFDSDSTKDSVQLIKMVPLSHNEINRYTDNKAYLIKLYDGTLSYEESRGDFFGTMAYYYDNNCLQYKQDKRLDCENNIIKNIMKNSVNHQRRPNCYFNKFHLDKMHKIIEKYSFQNAE